VYDYVEGKADWMGYGLPVEGEDGPFAGQQVRAVPTCGPDDTAARVLSTLEGEGGGDGGDVVVVLSGLAVGAVSRQALEEAAGHQPVVEVMEVVPSSVRPSILVATLAEAAAGPVLVTSSDGRLLGVVSVGGEDGQERQGRSRRGHHEEGGDHDGHDHEGHGHEGHDHEGHSHEGHGHEGHDHEGHSHEGHDHGGPPADEDSEGEIAALTAAVRQHFGDREPEPEELRAFLRDHLVSEGSTPEEADRFMAQLEDLPG